MILEAMSNIIVLTFERRIGINLSITISGHVQAQELIELIVKQRSPYTTMSRLSAGRLKAWSPRVSFLSNVSNLLGCVSKTFVAVYLMHHTEL